MPNMQGRNLMNFQGAVESSGVGVKTVEGSFDSYAGERSLGKLSYYEAN